MSISISMSPTVEAPQQQPGRGFGRTLSMLLRDLCSMVVLCYTTTHIFLWALALIPIPNSPKNPTSHCEAAPIGGNDYRTILAIVPQSYILRVTVLSSVLAFLVLELCYYLARRVGLRSGDNMPVEDVESAASGHGKSCIMEEIQTDRKTSR
ncbi:hypothetical protein C8F01DRAFT_1258118 [Mycena amicta]|nr:hypothetical protein C8F01DRAFT_1258118 [Mycena amicta]